MSTAEDISAPGDLPYLSASVPGCGGRIKERAEDFRVEEIPLYLPSGQGEHLYLRVEKQGATTHQLLSALAKGYGLPPSAVGYAGLKDSRAITTQWISLHTPQDADPALWPEGPWRLLERSRHGNKLRPGHLRANRFDIVVRGITGAMGLPEASRLIRDQGFPNYFGVQRFGRNGDNAARGKSLILGTANSRPSPQNARLMVNAYQAELFNRILARRLKELRSLSTLLSGDLAVLHRNGASFAVTEANLAEALRRSESGELSASAPLFGYRVPLAEGLQGDWERVELKRESLELADFRRTTKRLSPKGERRAIRVIPENLEAGTESDAGQTVLRIVATLPAGAYATSMLREIMKPPIALRTI